MDGSSRAASEATTDTVSATWYSPASAGVTDSVSWWRGLFDHSLSTGALKLEPDSIINWLNGFKQTLGDISVCRTELANHAANVAAGVQLGSFRPSQQIVEKMAARMGESEGGMAWALNSVLLGLADIHEALRQSLASHLDSDLEGAKIIDDVRRRFDDNADSAPK